MTLDQVMAQLWRRRLDLGWSQQYLAELMGTQQSHVSDLERRLISPEWETVNRMAGFLGYEFALVLAEEE